VLFAVCGLAAESVQDAASAEPNSPAETAVDSVAVTVNGVDIAEAEIEKLVKPQLERMTAQSQKLPPVFVEQYRQQLRQRMLQGLIEMALLDEKVKEANIVVTEEEVMERVKEITSQQKLSLEDFKALVTASGQSFDELKERIRKGASYEKLMEPQLAEKVNVTVEDANNYYNENKMRFETPEQVRVSHILITPDTTDPNADPNEAKAKAKAKAEGLLGQIKEEGADFAELAKANSACLSAARGGDLDFGRKATLEQRGTWVAPFEKVAFELKVGQVSDIVETQFGYHIIKATDHKDPNVITFDQAKDDIIQMLKQNKQREIAAQYVESLKAEANIVYPPGKEPPPVTIRP